MENMPLSQLIWSVLQPLKSKFVYKIQLNWSEKTLEISSL